ncbi:capsular polysaccharide export protein, LipB/KpsS family [Zavarzinella formosa]|uniref:capsular polysaccharide export protein, LipB/KpsS family n=1 Tax=Zavarzinella formosa TaxID=360055 RepID=UPI0002E95CE1|nr:hypothetical protein [Zavarzinella formosa]
MLKQAKSFLKSLPFTDRVNLAFKQWQVRGLPDFSSPESVNRWLLRRTQMEAPSIPFSTEVTHHQRLARWLVDLHQTTAQTRPELKGRRILVTALHNRTWIWYCMPIAMALAGRGATVDFAWAQFTDYLGEMPGNEYAVSATSIEEIALPVHPRLRFIPFNQLPKAETTAEYRMIAEKYGYRDTCHITARETCSPESNPEHARIARIRTARNLEALGRYARLLDEGNYDWAILPNGAIYEYGACYDLAKSQGVGCSAFDCHERTNVINVGDRQPCVYWDMTTFWEADGNHDLPPERLKRVTELLMRREQPNWAAQGDFVWHGQLAAVQPIPELLEKLSLSAEKPTALLCTNLAWDSAVLGRQRTFKSMIEWIIESIRWFGEHPEFQLIVRVHPVEKSVRTNEPVVATVGEQLPNLPSNVRLVDANEKVNTYGLMRLAHCGLAYTSTVGLEMATRGLPVVVAGKTHYAEHGFTIEEPDPESYFRRLGQLLAPKTPFRLTADEVRLAVCYADLFFEKMPRPFPWWNLNLNETFADHYPLAKLLTGDGPPEYLDTLDLFAGLPPQAR